ncbi:DNA adenine methylase [Cerasicoccus maritimus]|uniref:DNA adenine methylase n=1 Tax=Cerasicoccus maritimus TaxID=490089 RepID=UPI00285281CC|nr:DNA adenine methylase [Cerasicoccus maritimus]
MTTESPNPNHDDARPSGPLKSPLGYLGGKSRLAKQIVERIPHHLCYVEPYCGGAWVFFTKKPSRVEVLNDMDGELVTFWRVIQHHLPEFLRCLEFTTISREGFQQDNAQDPRLLSDVQRAVRYYRLQRMGYGGKTTGRTFGTSCVRPNSFHPLAAEDILRQTYERMARTTIEHLDACECIRRYDSETTFFYIDPPYWDCEKMYAVQFSKDDFLKLRNALREVKGKFILSLNDTPEVREIFQDFTIEEVTTKYSLGNSRKVEGTRNADRKELFIHNLDEVKA